MSRRIAGIIPARMAASRFPGKPLVEICGVSMVKRVANIASEYADWSSLTIATCDDEIKRHVDNDFKVTLTSDTHTRALDRVAEAFVKEYNAPNDDDIVVCVQGDEPMLTAEMIKATVDPLIYSHEVKATVLAMPIIDEELWRNPDTVKLIFNEEKKVLYTSRAPIPHSKSGFNVELGAYRIVGVFAFEWAALKEFTNSKESRLEKLEACDSNRIFELSFDQYIAPIDYQECFSVDSPDDIQKVESALKKLE